MIKILAVRKIHDEANILLFTIILSIVGIAFAAILTYDHYYESQLPLCQPETWLDCGKVNKGEYSEVLGVPLAVIGLIGFVLILSLSVIRLVHWHRDYTKNFFLLVLLFVFLGSIISWYLTYLEFFVIYAICPYCFTSFLLITIVLGVQLYGFIRGSSEEES